MARRFKLDDEDGFIHDWYADMLVCDLATKYGCGDGVVRRLAQELGLPARDRRSVMELPPGRWVVRHGIQHWVPYQPKVTA